MGDKSPKSKERLKKQDTKEKDQKKADALSKSRPVTAVPGKRSK